MLETLVIRTTNGFHHLPRRVTQVTRVTSVTSRYLQLRSCWHKCRTFRLEFSNDIAMFHGDSNIVETFH